MPPIEPPATQNSDVDPQMVDQHGLRAHHVADRHHRQIEPIGPPGRRIERGRAGRAHAAADDIRRNDEIAVGVDRPARPDHGLPPARLAGDRMIIRDMLVAGQRVADEDGVRLIGVEHAIGLIGDRQGAQRRPRRPSAAAGPIRNVHNEAVRRVDLAKAGRLIRRYELVTACRSFDMANIRSLV